MSRNYWITNHSATHLSSAESHDLLREELLARKVMGIIVHFDFLLLEDRDADTTQQGSSLTTLLALLFYAYVSEVYSSRKLAQAIQRDATFHLITAGPHTDNSLISSFRRRFRKELETLFVEIMEVVATFDLVNQHIDKPYNQSASELLRSNVADFFERAEQTDIEEAIEPATRHLPCYQENPFLKTSEPPFTTAARLATVNNKGGDPPPAGNRETEKNTWNKHSRTYTFLSKNNVIPALAPVPSQKSAHQWLTSRHTGRTPARLLGSLFRSCHQQPHLVKRTGTTLLILIPAVFITLILTRNAPHSIPTRGGSAAETRHLAAPALKIPSRETGNIYPLALPVSEDIAIPVPPDRGYRDIPAEVAMAMAMASQVSSNTSPSQATPVDNKPVFATPEKSASPAPEPVLETVIGTETGSSEAVTTPPEDPEQGTLIHREDWLLNQPPGHYMLQLLATRNEDLLLQVIAENHPDDLVAYYQVHIKASDWYILLYGNFLTRQTALDAINLLPEEYQGNHPWPRSYASVQAILLRQRDRTAR